MCAYFFTRYDEEDDLALINEPPGGEVRKIVWRNRFEKTYETQDGTPTVSTFFFSVGSFLDNDSQPILGVFI